VRLLVPVGAFALALLLWMPMRVAIDASGLSSRGLAASAVEGSIWHARITDTQLGPLMFGTLDSRLNLLPLFLGQIRISMVGADETRPFSAALRTGSGRFSLERASGQIAAGAMMAPAPVSAIEFTDLNISFVQGRCVNASGRVRASLEGPLATLDPQGLAGDARCVDGAVLLPLTGQSGLEQVELRIFGDGRFRMNIRTGGSSGAAGALLSAGFRSVSGGYALDMQGRF
jgi:general secretion pathway protein N